MANYSRIFGSQFPEHEMELIEYKDIGEAPAAIQLLARQYYSFMEAGNYTSAYNILKENKNDLIQYYIGMDLLNKLEEEIYNTQIFASKNNTVIIGTDVPDASMYTNATPWLKPVE